ncbi:MAG: pseudouridine-5'-phosphate glycosidase, partial [Candidatus Acidiferrum sp.]
MIPALLQIRPEIQAALRDGKPIVALESTLIAHGLPWPKNLETARAAETAIRREGVVPATIAVLHGVPTIGLNDAELEIVARAKDIRKASRRDISAAVANRANAATTVGGTLPLAFLAGIRILTTGGIGGVHPPHGREWEPADISADLMELSRNPVGVICAGAKSILDPHATLEALETSSVPVVGFQTNSFPAFYLRSSGQPTSARVDSPSEAAQLLLAHWQLGGCGAIIVQPVEEKYALDPNDFDRALGKAKTQAQRGAIRGPALTPYLLARLAEHTAGRTALANYHLVVANAALAARIACALCAG